MLLRKAVELDLGINLGPNEVRTAFVSTITSSSSINADDCWFILLRKANELDLGINLEPNEVRASFLSSLDLTIREKQIFDLLLKNIIVKEISTGLGLSEGTVKNYKNGLFHKLGVRSKTELVVRFMDIGQNAAETFTAEQIIANHSDIYKNLSIGLSPRQRQIAELINQGLMDGEIATAIGLTKGTVKNYLVRLFDRVDVSDRIGFIGWYRKHIRYKNAIAELTRSNLSARP